MEHGLRFAAIDIGSNAMRLLFSRVIVKEIETPYFIKESLIRMPLRLGRDAFTTGKISDKNCDSFVSTIIGFKNLIDAYNPISFRACATAAMRNAANGSDLVRKVQIATGINLDIISGQEEATMILSKDINQYLKTKKNYIHIDVGGGLGINYENVSIIKKSEYTKTLTDSLSDINAKLIFEPGRSIIGDCGLLVTKIEYIKETSTKNFMIVDASMSELIRPPLYGAYHKITPIIKHETQHKTYDIVGPVCESADFLGKDRKLNSKESELLVVEDVGAYGFVLSSNYNTRPRPAEYLISDGKINEIRSRDTLDQIISNESP